MGFAASKLPLPTLPKPFSFSSELAPRVFFKLMELKMLDLSGNKIQFIDGATFVDIPDLEIFKCNHCQLFQVIIL